jgi:hypothetical protein
LTSSAIASPVIMESSLRRLGECASISTSQRMQHWLNLSYTPDSFLSTCPSLARATSLGFHLVALHRLCLEKDSENPKRLLWDLNYTRV